MSTTLLEDTEEQDREQGCEPEQDAPPARESTTSFWASFFAGLGSFGLTCVILLCLMVLTYVGTYSQIRLGLVQAQKEFFDSWICNIGPTLGLPFGLRWPGAFLLLSLLAVNLITGGIVRLKWRRRTVGILIGHFGILLLLLAGLVKFVRSTNGYVQFGHGERVATYESFHEWEVVIGQLLGDGTVREHLIPDWDLRKEGVYVSEALPFELHVIQYLEHCVARPARTMLAGNVVDGYYLQPRESDSKAPVNMPGAYIEVHVPGEKPQRGILWSLPHQPPLTVRVKGVPWTFDLRRQMFDLPFQLRLDKFTKEEHPGVDRPRVFSSDVTKFEGGAEQSFHISMNNPMRYGGFMFSQNNWGPQDRPPPRDPNTGEPLYYSVLEVSSNPSDQWPKYACYVIAFGLLFHFLRKLMQHVERQNKMRRVA